MPNLNDRLSSSCCGSGSAAQRPSAAALANQLVKVGDERSERRPVRAPEPRAGGALHSGGGVG